jgi:hypothetical protein
MELPTWQSLWKTKHEKKQFNKKQEISNLILLDKIVNDNFSKIKLQIDKQQVIEVKQEPFPYA